MICYKQVLKHLVLGLIQKGVLAFENRVLACEMGVLPVFKNRVLAFQNQWSSGF
jgi:hypothetical protein